MMCICCDKRISLHREEEKAEESVVFEKEKIQIVSQFDGETIRNAGSYMWNDGVVGIISANFGSTHDGDEFVIAICDECIDKKLMTGNLAFIDNYMGGIKHEWIKEIYEKRRIAWRRYNKIDDLLNGD